jgi:hypothetical protein
MKSLRNAALALALAGVSATSHAGVKASAVNGGLFTFSNSEAFVALNNTGATTLSFNLAAAGKKVLTFSAYCAVYSAAGYTTAWLDVDIVVNGVVVAPTSGSGDPFCSSNGSGQFDGYVRTSTTVTIQAKEGSNSVRILARGSPQATGLLLGATSLVIHD